MKIGYVRVSKQEQHETLQIDALKFETCQVEQKKRGFQVVLETW